MFMEVGMQFEEITASGKGRAPRIDSGFEDGRGPEEVVSG